MNRTGWMPEAVRGAQWSGALQCQRHNDTQCVMGMGAVREPTGHWEIGRNSGPRSRSDQLQSCLLVLMTSYFFLSRVVECDIQYAS